MKKPLLTIATIAAAITLLNADTITWTGGAGTNDWGTDGNWDLNRIPQSSDSVVISGSSAQVVFTPSGDMSIQGTMTIGNGASLTQVTGGNYANFADLVLDGGTYDAGTCTGLTIADLTIGEGGALFAPACTPAVNGTLTMTGGTLQKFSKGASAVLKISGGELSYSGTISFASDMADEFTGGTIHLTGEMKPYDGQVLSGVNWSCVKYVPFENATTWTSGSLTVDNADYYYGGGKINLPEGSTASFTFQFPAASIYSSVVSQKFLYNGSAISESDFNSKFSAVDNGDGSCTFALLAAEGWSVGTPSVGEVDAQNNVTVTFTATKHSGSDTANVYVGCASSDLGDDIVDWAGSLVTVAEGVSSTTTYTPQLSLADGLNYIRAFVTYGGETVASAAISVRVLAYGDYGALTDVYEYIGSDNSLSTAANWAKDKSAPASEAPVAGTDTRWFGRNAVLTVSGFDLYSTDHFVGATINTISGNYDCHLNGDILLVDSSVTLSTIIIGETPYSITLTNSHFTTTRCPDGVAGFYSDIPDGAINFLSGAPSSFSFGKDNSEAHDSETVRWQLVVGGKLLLDGMTIPDYVWNQYFAVDVDGDVLTVAYNPVAAAYRIESVDAVTTASSATISATIGETTDDASVYVAYVEGNVAPSDQAVLAGTNLGTTFKGATVSTNLLGLSEFVSYSYTFGLVVGGNVVAKKSGSFTASDYKYAYINGAWINGVAPENLTVQDSVLITGVYTTGSEVNVKNTTLKDAVVTANTILYGDGDSMTLCNATYTNTRDNAALVSDVQYGIYESAHPLNFTSASGNGVVRRGDAYACYATEEQCSAVYANLFATEKIRLNGAAISEDVFCASFSTNAVDTGKSIAVNEETVPLKQLTITYWEPVWTGVAKANWTVLPGARVRLTKDTRIGALTVADATDVKIDLNGYNLKVSTLTVDGEKKKGEFTAANLSILTGEGSLIVGGPGFSVFVR